MLRSCAAVATLAAARRSSQKPTVEQTAEIRKVEDRLQRSIAMRLRCMDTRCSTWRA
jgi:hypothetical protein